MADILLGAPVCEQMKNDFTQRTRHLRLNGIVPKMAIIRVGEREDDLSYERNIIKVCTSVSVKTEKITLQKDSTQQELIDAIERVNNDASFHGLMLFRPLPKHMNELEVCKKIDPKKDIDGITDSSAASVFLGRGTGFSPCTAEACVRMLDYYNIQIAGKHAVIIGRSLVVGKPLSMMLLKRDATVTICHTKTKNMAELCRQADILIAAAGKSRLVTEDFLSDKQTVIDVGFNVDANGEVTGDVCFSAAEQFCSAITPVPKGVGSLTARLLTEHVIIAAELTMEK